MCDLCGIKCAVVKKNKAETKLVDGVLFRAVCG